MSKSPASDVCRSRLPSHAFSTWLCAAWVRALAGCDVVLRSLERRRRQARHYWHAQKAVHVSVALNGAPSAGASCGAQGVRRVRLHSDLIAPKSAGSGASRTCTV
eukprot:5194495-Pleurochrysis_carterae.AAC.4